MESIFVKVNLHKDVLFKVSTSEIESLSTIKCFNKKENINKIKKTNPNKINSKRLNKGRFKTKEVRILFSLLVKC